MAGGSTKVVVVAFLMNLGIAVTKFVAYFLTGSSSMIAEAVHSLADTSNQVFLYLGLKRSTREATSLHPFGYGMEQYIWSFMVAILIFSLGGIFSVYEGIHKLMHPAEGIEHVEINLIILGIAVVLESYSAWAATKEFRHVSGGRSIFQFARRSKDQVLVTVLFEDYAALLGLLIALIGNLVFFFTHDVLFDSIASILIGVLLAVIAFFLYREAKSMLVGESASPEDQRKILHVFLANPNVKEVKELLTMHLSPTQILVNAHVKFKPGLKLEEVEAIIDEIEDGIIREVPHVFRIFIETHQKSAVQPLHPQKESRTSLGKSRSQEYDPE